ncbi:MAG: acyltransferase family protein [Candidatus Methylomirabilia bacterium]
MGRRTPGVVLPEEEGGVGEGANPDSSRRYHAFDCLRAAAMLVGVFFHAALSFTDPPQIYWAANDSSRHVLVFLFAWATHGFRMQVFFLMSGFFAHLVYRRYGVHHFVRHRVKRLVLPFAGGIMLIVPIVQVVWLYGSVSGATEVPIPAVQAATSELLTVGRYLRTLGPAHLWFLEYLILFSGGALIASAVVGTLTTRCPLGWIDRVFRRLVRAPWKPLVLAVPTTATMYLMGIWILDGPSGFVPQPRFVVYYGLFFAFGWLLHRHPDLLALELRRYHWGYLGAALLLVGVTPVFFLSQPVPYHSYAGWYPFATLSLSSIYTWLMVFGLMGVFLQAIRRETPLIRYVSDSSYWVYLIHLPLVACLQIVLAKSPVPGILKYLIIIGIALVLLFLSYEHLVRYTLIGATLNGRRERPVGRRLLSLWPSR